MAIPNHPEHRDHLSTDDPDVSQRALSSKALPLVVLVVLIITIIATYYWYAA